jgi:hypothetical protein
MAHGSVETAGETLAIRWDHQRMADLVERAVGAALIDSSPAEPTVSLDLSSATEPFDLSSLRPVTRDAWSDGTRTVLRNACGSGFDLQVTVSDQQLGVSARYRPSKSLLAANNLLRSRFRLLAGQTLIHYPALWRAGWRGRVPLHAGVLDTVAGLPLLAGPSGVGKSTVVAAAVAAGASATSDNLSCGDGAECFGVSEPRRLTGLGKARTSHGRSDASFTGRVASLSPDRVVVLERGQNTCVEAAKPDEAARALVAGTYAAGELRRYWQFAATLALATGVGPAHPAVSEVAAAYTDRLPCVRARIGDGDRISVAELCGEQL